MKFPLQQLRKLAKPYAQPRNSDRSNPFIPSVLIIGRHRENLLEQHLRRKTRAVRRKFRAAIAAECAGPHDGGGQGRARNTRKQDRLIAIEYGERRQRRTQHDTWLQPDSLSKRL